MKSPPTNKMDRGESQDKPKLLPKGTVIAGRYRLEKGLGYGGMGSVYLAEDQLIEGEKIALKILHPDLVSDDKQTQRFLREVNLMQRVNHKNVVRTFDVGSDQNTVFFTMEYVPGQPLENFIEGQNFPRSQLENLIIQTCEGLEAIHKANIIHRDLKPANILVLPDGTVKITDFGVARPEVSNLTAHNEIIGSALYIAPEIWLGTKLSPSVDLYSLGVLLYELTTGALPFDGDSPAALMRMHLEFQPTEPKELNAEIPSWLNKLILRLLAKSPLDRPRDAREVIEYVKLQLEEPQKNVAMPQISDKTFLQQMEGSVPQTFDSIRGPQRVNLPQKGAEQSKLPPVEVCLREILRTSLIVGMTLAGFAGLSTLLAFLARDLAPTVAQLDLTQLAAQGAENPNLFSAGEIGLFLALAVPSFILRFLLPLAAIGALSGSVRTMLKGTARATVLLLLTAILTLLWLEPKKFDSLSILSLAIAGKETLGSLSLLDPLVSSFQSLATENSYFLIKSGTSPVRTHLPLVLGAMLSVLFLALTVRDSFANIYRNSKLVFGSALTVAFAFLIVAPEFANEELINSISSLHDVSIFGITSKSSLNFWRPVYAFWLILGLIIFVTNLLARLINWQTDRE